MIFGIIEIANTISKAIDNVVSEKNHEISTQSQEQINARIANEQKEKYMAIGGDIAVA